MASGREHNASTLGMATGYLTGYFSGYVLFPDQAALVPVGMVIGLVIGPDLDVDAGSRSNYHIRRLFGAPGDYLWSNFWLPYAIAIKHRNFLSHGIIIGTLIRLIYMAFPIIINLFSSDSRGEVFVRSVVSQALAIPLNTALLLVWYYRIDITPFLYPLFFGMVAADALHLLFDKI